MFHVDHIAAFYANVARTSKDFATRQWAREGLHIFAHMAGR